MNCRICSRPVSGEGALSDGSAFHQACYRGLAESQPHLQELKERGFGADSLPTAEKRLLATLSKDLDRERSMAAKIRRALSGQPSQESAISDRIKIASARIADLGRMPDSTMPFVDAELSRLNAVLEPMHDLWLTYPPDWEVRRQNAIAASRFCSRCGTDSRLQVHHQRPVGQGGTHKPANLVVLCRGCHQGRHGGAQFGARPADPSPRVAEIIKTLQSAIENGSCVQFHYEKYDGERSKRRMLPSSFETIGERDSLCVRGFCMLRKEERTFAVRRMSRVCIVEHDG